MEVGNLQGTLFSNILNYDEIIIMTKNLSSLIVTGVPIETALSQVSNHLPGKCGKVLKKVSDSVSAGEGFADALTKFPDHFSEIFVSMIRVGEVSGEISSQLDKINKQAQKEKDLQGSFKKMLRTPKNAIIVCFLLAFVNFVLLIPATSGISGTQGLPTVEFNSFINRVIDISNILTDNLVYAIIGLVALIILTQIIFTSKVFATVLQEIFMIVPSFSKFLKKSSISVFFKGLSILISSGTPISVALQMAGNMTSRREMHEVAFVAAHLIDDGDSLADAFYKLEYFENDVIARVKNAEKTGDYETMFEDTSEYFEIQAQEYLDTAMRTIKIMAMGFAFAFAIFQIFLLIYPAISYLSELF